MPQTNRWSAERQGHVMVISCSRCDTAVELEGFTNWLDGSETDLFRWQPTRERYHSWCKACERAHRLANPQRRSSPVAGLSAEGRRFGLELELNFPAGESRRAAGNALRHAGLRSWKIATDGSLGARGMEVRSPPLQGENGYEQARIACRALFQFGATPDARCGFHVHHEVTDLRLQDFKNLVTGWSDHQSLIEGLVSPSRRDNTHCRPMSPSELNNIISAESLQDLRSRAARTHRWRALSLNPYPRYGTVEVRMHQGTADGDKAVNWVKFGQAMIDAARRGALAVGDIPALPDDGPSYYEESSCTCPHCVQMRARIAATRAAREEAAGSPIPEAPAARTVRELFDRLGEALDETAQTYLIGRAVHFGHAAAA